jgi:uncharacterized metal-binding protein
MKKVNYCCAKCSIMDRVCLTPGGRSIAQCPTRGEQRILKAALKEYRRSDIKEFARLASVQEGACYIHRDAKPFVMVPSKTRIEEVIEFCRRLGYRRLGLAFCSGLAQEASILTDILEDQGFEVVTVVCKVGGVPKETIGIKDKEKVKIGHFESMCNPITQAKILNRAKTDFNIMLGLCVGHDSLFLKYIKGLTTVFAVKDRVTGHNPLAAIYTHRSYYQRLLKNRKARPKGKAL